jgi:hypothetical protein
LLSFRIVVSLWNAAVKKLNNGKTWFLVRPGLILLPADGEKGAIREKGYHLHYLPG